MRYLLSKFNRRSLTSRLILLVVLTVAITLGIFTTLTALRLERGADAQQRAVSEIAWQQVSKQLRLQSNLIASELTQMRKQAADAAGSLAASQDTAALLKRGNIVAIDMALQRAVKNTVLDGVLALDTDLKALGSHRPGLVLARANAEIEKSVFAAAARGLIDANDRRDPKSITRFQPVTLGALKSYGVSAKADMFEVMSLNPVFDEFGDVIALLLSHRLIGADSPTLVRFARNENLGIRVLEGDNILLNAGIDRSLHDLPEGHQRGEMGRTEQGSFLYFCSGFEVTWQLCVFEPISFLTDLTSSLISFTLEEQKASLRWLIGFAVASVLFATVATTLAATRVLSPLQQITRAVRSVSKGNWMTHVAGQKRRDEVGEIARSVAMLQSSIKEREKLRADVADIEHLRQQQIALNEVAHGCRAALRQRVFSLSDMMEGIDGESRNVSSLAALAEGEVDEARLAAGRVLSKLKKASSSGHGLEQGSQKQDVGSKHLMEDTIDRIGKTALQISIASHGLAGEVARMSSEVGKVDAVVRDFMSRLPGGGTAPVASAARKLSCKTGVETAPVHEKPERRQVTFKPIRSRLG